MPTSYVLEPGFCWFGIDRSTWPPGYRLGICTVRLLMRGLDAHLQQIADAARTEAEQRHNARLAEILRLLEAPK